MRQLNDNSNNANQIDEEPWKRDTTAQRGPHCHTTPRLELIKGSRASLTVTDVTEERIRKGAVSGKVIRVFHLSTWYSWYSITLMFVKENCLFWIPVVG